MGIELEIELIDPDLELSPLHLDMVNHIGQFQQLLNNREPTNDGSGSGAANNKMDL